MPNQLNPVQPPPLNWVQQFLKNWVLPPPQPGSPQGREESAQQYRQMYGPTYSPPVTEEIPGYAQKRMTDLNQPYYVPPTDAFRVKPK